ncbi:MAG TPA: NAD-dependent epimerase/dehydratase family protein [Rhodocyclaceae bacterium]|nr:NAD-dependent epimerase/dehydratase family protein [Rhodocyclaceae bacterium]
MRRLLIIGCGDVMRRALPRLLRRYRVYALVRQPDPELRNLGVTQIIGDLDQPATLKRLAGLADIVLHSAPPAETDIAQDHRTQRLLAALQTAKSVPRRLVYISTSGVYGDCGGAEIDETRPIKPESARAARRVAAERQLRRFGSQGVSSVSILRAPGIYAADRLPLDRVKRGDPVLHASEDSYSNHIHADDLAEACVRALQHGRSNRVYNVSDDSRIKMGDWFTQLAKAFELPPPPRVHWVEAEQKLSPALLSFLRESRRIGNARIKRELGLRLSYPTVESGIAAARQPAPVVKKKTSAKPKKKAPLKKKRRTETQLPLF